MYEGQHFFMYKPALLQLHTVLLVFYVCYVCLFSIFQKPGVSLSRLSLVTHCISDRGFLHFICELPLLAIKVIKISKIMHTFICSFVDCNIYLL